MIDGQLDWSTPKTAKSARSFRVGSTTREALLFHRHRQDAEAEQWGEAWANTRDLVFVAEDGEPIHPNQLTREFKQIANAAGLPPIRLHDLRTRPPR